MPLSEPPRAAPPAEADVVLEVGTGQRAGYVRGWVMRNGRRLPIRTLCVVGPGLPRWHIGPGSELRMPTLPLSEPAGPYSRIVGTIGAATLERLAQLRLVLIGAGGTGSLFADAIARLMPHGHLTIVDPDVLKPHNRTAWLRADIPLDRRVPWPSKARALADIVSRLPCPPDLEVIEVGVEDWRVLGPLRRADLIVSCVDSPLGRLACSFLSGLYIKPHIDIGTGVFLQETGDSVSNWPSETMLPQDLLQSSSVRLAGAEIRLCLPGSESGGCLLCLGGVGGVTQRDRPFWRLRAGTSLFVNHVAVGEAGQILVDLMQGRRHVSCHIRYERGSGAAPQFEEVTAPRQHRMCPVCDRTGLGDLGLEAYAGLVSEILGAAPDGAVTIP